MLNDRERRRLQGKWLARTATPADLAALKADTAERDKMEACKIERLHAGRIFPTYLSEPLTQR